MSIRSRFLFRLCIFSLCLLDLRYVQSDHVDSDWLRTIMWSRHWPLIGPASPALRLVLGGAGGLAGGVCVIRLGVALVTLLGHILVVILGLLVILVILALARV